MDPALSWAWPRRIREPAPVLCLASFLVMHSSRESAIPPPGHSPRRHLAAGGRLPPRGTMPCSPGGACARQCRSSSAMRPARGGVRAWLQCSCCELLPGEGRRNVLLETAWSVIRRHVLPTLPRWVGRTRREIAAFPACCADPRDEEMRKGRGRRGVGRWGTLGSGPVGNAGERARGERRGAGLLGERVAGSMAGEGRAKAWQGDGGELTVKSA